VPAGKAFRTDPSSFIRRTSADALEFEAAGADGSQIRMIPLADVLDEQYVVYFYSAGTKPPQPAVHYCPTSAGVAAAGAAHDEAQEDEFGCEPAWPPSAPETPASRGVRWGIDAHGRIAPHQPVYTTAARGKQQVVEKDGATEALASMRRRLKSSTLDVDFLALQPR